MASPHLILLTTLALTASAVPASAADLGMKPKAPSLEGTWALVSVDNVAPDGSRNPLFGDAPQGVLTFDTAGHYTLQILRSDRPKFAGNDRTKGTPEENQAAVAGANTHFGTYSLDRATGVVTFSVEHAFFPNWEGRRISCKFVLTDDQFTFINPSPSSGTNVVGEVKWRKLSN